MHHISSEQCLWFDVTVTCTMPAFLQQMSCHSVIFLKLWMASRDESYVQICHCALFQPVDVRFIEYMPFDGNRWNFKRMVSYQQMVDMIRDKWPDFERLSDGPNDTSKVDSMWMYTAGLCCAMCFLCSVVHECVCWVCLHSSKSLTVKVQNCIFPYSWCMFFRFRFVNVLRMFLILLSYFITILHSHFPTFSITLNCSDNPSGLIAPGVLTLWPALPWRNYSNIIMSQPIPLFLSNDNPILMSSRTKEKWKERYIQNHCRW